MAEIERRTFVSLPELFPQQDPDECRVCGFEVQPPMRKYCSKYCRNVAKAVSSLYEWSYLRSWVKRRDDNECVNCGSQDGLEIDHVIPVSKGGHPFDPGNLQTLCSDCHARKGTKEQDLRPKGTGGVRLKKRDVRQQLLDEVTQA